MQCTCSQAHCISKVIVKHHGITAEALHMALLTPHELRVPTSCLLGTVLVPATSTLHCSSTFLLRNLTNLTKRPRSVSSSFFLLMKANHRCNPKISFFIFPLLRYKSYAASYKQTLCSHKDAEKNLSCPEEGATLLLERQRLVLCES